MVKIYVEGGGDTQDLKSRCRKGFLDLLSQDSEIAANKPRIIACGSRGQAFDAFKNSLRNHENALLLIDSEGAVSSAYYGKPWEYLKRFECWDGLNDQSDDYKCHLMVQAMEAWLLADEKVLNDYYGNGFKLDVPKTVTVENWSKDQMAKFLSKAVSCCKTKNNKKREYDKGRDSFVILSKVNLDFVCSRSVWAKRFVNQVKIEIRKGK